MSLIYSTEILSFFNTFHKHIDKYIPSWHNTNSISAEIRLLNFQPFMNSHFCLYIIVELVTSQELPQQNVRKWCRYFENCWTDIHDGYSCQPSMFRTSVNTADEWMNVWMVFGFESFRAWCSSALKQALYAPWSITRLKEPCSFTKVLDDLSTWFPNILRVQKEGSHTCIYEWSQGLTCTQDVDWGFLLSTTVPTYGVITQPHYI